MPLVPSQSAEQITVLCRNFNDTQTNGMEGPREGQDPAPRPLARHLSDADRLRKVIQEFMDTEKSYVKVTEDAVLIPCSPLVMASCMLAGAPGCIYPGPCHSPGRCLLLEVANCCQGGREGGGAERACRI